MKDRDDLFDKKVKAKLKEENRVIPEGVNRVFDNTLNNLENKKFNWKRTSGICAACICGVLIFGITMPAYATNIPIIGGIFEIFQSNVYENYDEYASELNITKESRGVKVTINNVVYDGLDLSIFYKVESETPIKGIPSLHRAELKINGKKTSFGSGERGEFFNDKKTFIGMKTYSVGGENMVPEELQDRHFGGKSEIPEEFILDININAISGIKEDKDLRGKWDFQIPVSSEKVKGKVKEYDLNVDLGSIEEDTVVTKVITTPINTAIQWKTEGQESDVGFYVFDHKGRFLEAKSGSGKGSPSENGEFLGHYNYQFKEVYSDSNAIVFIPYVDLEIKALNEKWRNSSSNKGNSSSSVEVTEKVGEDAKDISGILNLQGESKILSKDGKEYTTITKVVVEDGKTKVYYKSQYGIYGSPLEIINNKTGEKIKNMDNFERMQLDNIRYNIENNEYMVIFDGVIDKGECSIKARDFSKKIKVYEEEKFEVNLK